VRGDGTISVDTAKDGLQLFGVDGRGLDKVDRAILGAVCKQFHGGPVGLSTLAISVGEQPETVEDVYEPFLIQQGMLARTPRGPSGHGGGVRAHRARSARGDTRRAPLALRLRSLRRAGAH
jgi:Holliday junction resolvasome RuvABC ATP-dependent DNA helicase subunit